MRVTYNQKNQPHAASQPTRTNRDHCSRLYTLKNTMPAHFNQYGISFQYPENWTLEEEEMEDLPEEHHVVTVYSPGGAFWEVTIHPRSSNPKKMASAVAKAMKEEYEGVEVEDAADSLLDHDLIGYDFSFIYLDLINTAQIRGLQDTKCTYTIFCQGEDREFQAIHPVFQAMTVSLLQGMK
jgi:hypothetical protein